MYRLRDARPPRAELSIPGASGTSDPRRRHEQRRQTAFGGPTATSQAERNRRLFLTSFAQFASGNPDILRSVLREDFIEHSPGNPSGRDAFVEFIKSSPVAAAQPAPSPPTPPRYVRTRLLLHGR